MDYVLEKDGQEIQKVESFKPTTRKGILAAAEHCVCGEREQDYGTPEQNFASIADLWTTYLAYLSHEVTPRDVAAMMILLKVARIASGHGKMDNWVDIAGYAACGGELDGR